MSGSHARGGFPLVRRSHAAAPMIAVVAAVALTLAGCGSSDGGSTTAATAGPGQGFAAGAPIWQVYPAAERGAPVAVSGELLDGGSFDLASWRGRVVAVNFWASWCAPCRAEAGDLNDAYRATKALGVEFLGVDIRDQRDAGQAFVDGFAMPYPSLFDPAGKVSLALRDVNPNVIPTTVVVDRQGRAAAVFRKRVSAIELETVLRKIAAEPADPAVAGG